MTDIKPFSQQGEANPADRTVAALLMPVLGGCARNVSAWMPFGQTTLLDIAADVLMGIEADERVFCADSGEASAWFAGRGCSEIRMIGPGPARGSALTEDPWGIGRFLHGIRASHAMVLCAGSPFLRPSSASEAVRLFKMRLDIVSLRACVRNHHAICDSQGHSLVAESQTVLVQSTSRPTFRLLDTFAVFAVASSYRSGTPTQSVAFDPYPFELSEMEGFVVDSDSALSLAVAHWDRNSARA